MPNPEADRHLAGPDPDGGAKRGRGDGDATSRHGGPQARSFRDAKFQADDARLSDKLDRYDREHQGSGEPVDGSRFGFFANQHTQRRAPEVI